MYWALYHPDETRPRLEDPGGGRVDRPPDHTTTLGAVPEADGNPPRSPSTQRC